MEGDSCSEGCRFQSQHWKLDGHFSHLFVAKIIMFVWKDENKLKRGRDGLFFKIRRLNIWAILQTSLYKWKGTGKLLEILATIYSKIWSHWMPQNVSLALKATRVTWKHLLNVAEYLSRVTNSFFKKSGHDDGQIWRHAFCYSGECCNTTRTWRKNTLF